MAKSYSRARVVSILKNMFTQVSSEEEVAVNSLESIKESNVKDYYDTTFSQIIGKAKAARVMLKEACRGFNVEYDEVDNRMSDWMKSFPLKE